MYCESVYYQLKTNIQAEFGLEFLEPKKVGRKRQLPELKRIVKSFRILPFIIPMIKKACEITGESQSSFIEMAIIERLNRLSIT